MQMTIFVRNLTRENAERFEAEARHVEGVYAVDTWKGKATIAFQGEDGEDVVRRLQSALRAAGFDIEECVDDGMQNNARVMKVCVDGMTCRSCEITIERKFKKIPGVRSVNVDAASGVAKIMCHDGCTVDIGHLQKAIVGEKYSVRGMTARRDGRMEAEGARRPSFFRLAGLFVLVLLLGWLFNTFGVVGQSVGVAGSMTFVAALALGLVAGSSSCLAVSGGLLLSSAGKFNERYGGMTKLERMRPVFFFVAGRVLAYGILGGLIGLVGAAFTPSPFFNGTLIMLAALYMLAMGLEMLHISPPWLKACMPRMPKALSHRIVDAEGREHWAAPFLLGSATFFLPCGFTQALQVYALTTGSFAQSALILAAFALGTAPALLALGWASSSLNGKAGKFFFQFSGALVIVLGLWNVQNGLTVAGYPLSFARFGAGSNTAAASVGAAEWKDPNVRLENGVQRIAMKLTANSPYYAPSNTFTVKAGVPVRIEINGRGTGCRSIFQIPKLGVSEYLNKPATSFEFTPDKAGEYAFSCSMGMYPGVLNVVSS